MLQNYKTHSTFLKLVLLPSITFSNIFNLFLLMTTRPCLLTAAVDFICIGNNFSAFMSMDALTLKPSIPRQIKRKYV